MDTVLLLDTEEDLLDIADHAMEIVKRMLPDGCQAEMFLCRGKDRGIEFRDGRLESLHESRDEGIGLRVLRDGRMGFASMAGLNLDTLGNVLDKVLDQIPHIPPDPYRGFPAPQKTVGSTRELAQSMTDPSLFARPLQDQMPRLEAVQSSVLKSDPRIQKVLRMGYGESWSEVVVVNTLGVRSIESGTHCSVGLATVGRNGNQVQIGTGSNSARWYHDLDFDRVGRDAVFRTVSLLDAKKPPTQRRSIIFDSWIAGEFLDLIAASLCADNIQRGKSIFRGKLGQKVASPLVNLIDDPRLPRGLASASFDDEGTPTRRRRMIDKGLLKEFFYDTYTANKEGRASNASAGRASYKGLPGPSSSNFFMEPGAVSRDHVLADTKDGILVLEVMGMHMADTISGEFSVGISGIAVQDGRLTGGVRGAMLAGNISEILERIDAVADDLTFYGRIAAPTFRVPGMMVA